MTKTKPMTDEWRDNPMSYKQIDEQFESIKGYIRDVGVGQYNDDGVNIGFKKSKDIVKDLLHLIYTQAKAEQREIDAGIAQGKQIGILFASGKFRTIYNTACEEIATAIRED